MLCVSQIAAYFLYRIEYYWFALPGAANYSVLHGISSCCDSHSPNKEKWWFRRVTKVKRSYLTPKAVTISWIAQTHTLWTNGLILKSLIRATPHCRIFNHLILTRHLYHHTPLVEYILKHLYMYPRTRVFGSWDITQTYHRPYAHICMHMHTYGYTCVHLHADVRPLPHPRLTLHAYACMCIHMCPYACRCVHMDTHWGPTPCIPSICMHERACACICVHLGADGFGYAPYCVFQQGL